MPDAHGNIKGISIPRIPWQEEPEAHKTCERCQGSGDRPTGCTCKLCEGTTYPCEDCGGYGTVPASRDA